MKRVFSKVASCNENFGFRTVTYLLDAPVVRVDGGLHGELPVRDSFLRQEVCKENADAGLAEVRVRCPLQLRV